MMKIFETKPKNGTPVSHKMIFNGLLRMAKAWEFLAVHNGHVDWSNGIPTIVMDTLTDSEGNLLGSGSGENPFKVTLSGGNILISLGRAHFWKQDAWLITELEIDAADAWTPTASEVEGETYVAEYIYAQLKYESGSWGWSLGHGADNPQNAGADQDDQEQRTWVLAYIDTDGVIDQRINQDIYETMGG